MINPSEEKPDKDEALIIDNQTSEQESTEKQEITYTIDSLMPELEELVKKNPNRLIGCGG
jgi:hypothetical protein